jgi:hypothetical protein
MKSSDKDALKILDHYATVNAGEGNHYNNLVLNQKPQHFKSISIKSIELMDAIPRKTPEIITSRR